MQKQAILTIKNLKSYKFYTAYATLNIIKGKQKTKAILLLYYSKLYKG